MTIEKLNHTANESDKDVYTPEIKKQIGKFKSLPASIQRIVLNHSSLFYSYDNFTDHCNDDYICHPEDKEMIAYFGDDCDLYVGVCDDSEYTRVISRFLNKFHNIDNKHKEELYNRLSKDFMVNVPDYEDNAFQSQSFYRFRYIVECLDMSLLASRNKTDIEMADNSIKIYEKDFPKRKFWDYYDHEFTKYLLSLSARDWTIWAMVADRIMRHLEIMPLIREMDKQIEAKKRKKKRENEDLFLSQ